MLPADLELPLLSSLLTLCCLCPVHVFICLPHSLQVSPVKWSLSHLLSQGALPSILMWACSVLCKSLLKCHYLWVILIMHNCGLACVHRTFVSSHIHTHFTRSFFWFLSMGPGCKCVWLEWCPTQCLLRPWSLSFHQTLSHWRPRSVFTGADPSVPGLSELTGSRRRFLGRMAIFLGLDGHEGIPWVREGGWAWEVEGTTWGKAGDAFIIYCFLA